MNYLPISNVDMASATYGHPGLFLLDATAGFLMTVSAAQLLASIRRFRVLECIGENTMAIFVIHKPLVIKASSLFSVSGFAALGMTVVIALCVVAICCGCAWILNRWLPWTVGRPANTKKGQSKAAAR